MRHLLHRIGRSRRADAPEKNIVVAVYVAVPSNIEISLAVRRSVRTPNTRPADPLRRRPPLAAIRRPVEIRFAVLPSHPDQLQTVRHRDQFVKKIRAVGRSNLPRRAPVRPVVNTLVQFPIFAAALRPDNVNMALPILPDRRAEDVALLGCQPRRRLPLSR